MTVEDGVVVGEAVGVPDDVAEMVKTKKWCRPSAELYKAWEDVEDEAELKTGVTGPVLSGVALLGAGPPRFKNLADAEVIDERPAPPLRAGEVDNVDDAKLKHLEARTRGLDAQLTRLTEANAALSRRMDFSGLEGRAAGDVGQEAAAQGASSTALAVVAAVRGWLQQFDLDPSDPNDVADALAGVLRTRPDLASALTPEDRRRVAESLALNDEVEGDEPSFWEETDVRPEPDPQEGAPVYGSRARFAESLAGTGGPAEGRRRAELLESIAKEKGWRLTRSEERRLAERELYKRVNPDVDVTRAATFTEAAWCVGKYLRLTMSQEQNRAAEVAKEAARLRPDLVEPPASGSPGRKPAARSRREEDALVTLTEKARQLCRDQDTPLTDDNVRRAKAAVLGESPELAPQYGWTRRRRGTR